VTLLVLEDGRVFNGDSYGANGETIGEAVFCTAMTGYQETLTDPSYHRQVVIMTAPHIGNTGVNDDDDESSRIWVAGYVVRDPARLSSSWRSTGSLDDRLVAQGVVGISGIDTRALTRHLRERGAMRVGISSTETDPAALLDRVQAAPVMSGSALAAQVSTSEVYRVEAVGERHARVAILDLGLKAMTPRRLAECGIETVVLPATSTLDELLATEPDGVFFSNGPGDPATADREVEVLRGVLERGIPYFGICFGNQLFGRALGLSTYKLGYGHRGINQPVMDLTTGKVEVTAHNHGFAVGWPGREHEHSAVGWPGREHEHSAVGWPGREHEHSAVGWPGREHEHSAVEAPLDTTISTPYGAATVSHVCLNDDVVEGLELTGADGRLRAFSVQYHPEAAAGPHDAGYLFHRFLGLMVSTGAGGSGGVDAVDEGEV
jgi:carbamoyl-phosphate synthase small subunit